MIWEIGVNDDFGNSYLKWEGHRVANIHQEGEQLWVWYLLSRSGRPVGGKRSSGRATNQGVAKDACEEAFKFWIDAYIVAYGRHDEKREASIR